MQAPPSSIDYWRGGSGSNPDVYRHTHMELILTKDDGHLAALNAVGTSQASALPRTLEVGLENISRTIKVEKTNVEVFVPGKKTGEKETVE